MADEPMIPTSLEKLSHKELMDKYYDDSDKAAVLGYPIQVDEYAAYIYNDNEKKKSDAKIKAKSNYVPRKGNNPRLDKIINRFMFSTSIGVPITDYSYSPSNGGLKGKRGVNMNYMQANQNFLSSKYFGSFKYRFNP